MKRRCVYPRLRAPCIACLALALAVCVGGMALTLANQTRVRIPYADVQLAAARRMERAEQVLLDYVKANGIEIEKDDLNKTGLIGPEWTELTTSLGMIEAKRTALQPDFAALMVKYYKEAGLKSGDTICCGMSGSFPGLCLAAVAAANEMDIRIRIIASYGSSMYGATRMELPVMRVLEIAREAGLIDYELVAVSPGGDFDQGNSILFPDSREKIFALAEESGFLMIDEANIPDSVQRRLELFGTEMDCFVNVGGASANVGTSPYTLTFPNGLVTDPPRIPLNADRGLAFEYAARHIPVIHLLNIRGLAEENGIPFDPVPLTRPGDTDVYHDVRQSPWYCAASLAISLFLLWLGKRLNKTEERGTCP